MNAAQRRRRASWAAFQKAKKMSPDQRREAALKAAAAKPKSLEKRPYIPQDSESVDIPSDAFSAAEEDGEWEE